MRLLSEVANLMYQITEFMLSRQKRLLDGPGAGAGAGAGAAERGTGARRSGEGDAPRDPTQDLDLEAEEEERMRSDMVPDMLKKVLCMVAHLVRVKKELAERVSFPTNTKFAFIKTFPNMSR